jgi:hypothetical protein
MTMSFLALPVISSSRSLIRVWWMWTASSGYPVRVLIPTTGWGRRLQPEAVRRQSYSPEVRVLSWSLLFNHAIVYGLGLSFALTTIMVAAGCRP